METMAAAPAPQQRPGRIARRLARLLRRKSSPAGAAGMAYSVAGDELFDDSLDSSINSLSKLKLSGNLAAAYTLDAFFKNATENKGVPTVAPQTQSSPEPAPPSPAQDAAKHAFVATLFARASAVKAAYAQLQLAQHPYDAESIQAADAGLVAELTKLSSLKRRYTRDPASAAARTSSSAAATLAAQADEQRHLLRTYEITARKLEAELRARDAEAERARAALADEVRAARALEERARNRTLAALDDLHLSGLNATHFLTALRHALKSVRSFARAMHDAMRAAGWDPAAAAAAAVRPQGATLRNPEGDARFALESYVALKMFAGFHRKDLGLSSLHGRGASTHDRRRFFEEFAEAKDAPAAELLSVVQDDDNASGDDDARRWGALREFVRDRYVSVVHERMEAAFFGRGGSASAAVPRAAWLGEFAEMARRVWLLHCLFWAFDGAASVFQARPGDRFSEVFMESVSDADGGGGTTVAPTGHVAVGFTVVPGFKLGRTVIQCRVYLSHPEHRRP